MDKRPSDAMKANGQILRTQVLRASDAIVAEMDRRFTAAISADIWKWPRQPSPRDIVDTGALRASQQYSKLQDGSYQFSWGVPYAAYVHEGVTFTDGTDLPARPWTTYALRQMQQDRTVEKLIEAELNGDREASQGPAPDESR